MKKLCFLFCLLAFSKLPFAQSTKTKTPKLVVGIVVDQMRYDYIYRYWNKFGNGGFKKLVNGGYFCKNAHYNYVPTYTAPGHACIYTGTSPSVNGIISNLWFDKFAGKKAYCVEDSTAKPLGTTASKGKMSPKRLLSTTITDQLRLSNMLKSKTFGIALKDRSSILPAGHNANGAFWFDGSVGGFVSSSFYMSDLPQWLKDFNAKNLVTSYLSQGWKPLLPLEQYTESTEDKSAYESSPTQPDQAFFPYDYTKIIQEKRYDMIAYTPYGNSITKDLALECLRKEQLGKDEFTDMLCVSFSSTDIIAHAYGIRAIEVEDVYLRLDKDLEEFINALEKEVGKGNFTLFLTADHGAAENTEYLKANKIPGGLIDELVFEKQIRTFLKDKYGDSLALSYYNQQVFLNEKAIAEKKLNKDEIINTLSNWLMQQPGISEVFSAQSMRTQNYTEGSMKHLIQNGYHHKFSGDVIVNYLPGWMEHDTKGTTHGAPYSYDTHVPLIFYGAGIVKGESVGRVHITDIAPTIAQLLNIEYPSGCTGKPVGAVLGK